MVSPLPKIKVNNVQIEVFKYSNSSVLFLNPESPAWVRTSTSGLYIFERLKENPATEDEISSMVAKHYQLPEDIVKEDIKLFLNEMIFHRFFVLNGAYEWEKDSLLPQACLNDFSLYELWIDITSLCKGACQHCYKPKPAKVSHYPLDKLEDLFLQARGLGVSQLIISGGEPLLHPEFPSIMCLARETHNWQIQVITSGQKVDSEVVDVLMEKADIVQVSMDGVDKETNDVIRGSGAFEGAIELFKMFSANKNRKKKRIGLSFTPLPQNIHQVQKLDKLGYALGIDFIHLNHPRRGANATREGLLHSELCNPEFLKKAIDEFNKLNSKIWAERQDSKDMKGIRQIFLDQTFLPAYDLLDLVKKTNCGAGISKLAVTEEGDVFPCIALQGHAKAFLGNLHEGANLSELYKLSRDWNLSIFSVDNCEGCKECHFRYLCGGGCRARAEFLSGPDLVCEVIKENYHQFFELIGNVYDYQVDKKGDEGSEIRKSYHQQCS